MTNFKNRIETNPKILGEKPVIRGTRIPIFIILQMLRDCSSFEDIINGYPVLLKEDVKAVLDNSLYLLNDESNEEISLVQ